MVTHQDFTDLLYKQNERKHLIFLKNQAADPVSLVNVTPLVYTRSTNT